MKNIFYLFLILSIIVIVFFTGCSVNAYTGLIQVKNYTNKTLKNVKIGDTIIAYSLDPGSEIDYWFFSTITGKLTEDTLGVYESQKDLEWELKTNYWITIFAREFSDGSKSVALTYSKNGTKDNEQSLVSETD